MLNQLSLSSQVLGTASLVSPQRASSCLGGGKEMGKAPSMKGTNPSRMVYSPQLLSDVWVNSGNSLNITIGQHLDIHTIAVLTCDLLVTGDFSCLLWMFALGGGWSLKIETADNSLKRTHKKWKGLWDTQQWPAVSENYRFVCLIEQRSIPFLF